MGEAKRISQKEKMNSHAFATDSSSNYGVHLNGLSAFFCLDAKGMDLPSHAPVTEYRLSPGRGYIVG